MLRARPPSQNITRSIERDAQTWRRVLEWALILYVVATMIEGALFSVGTARVARFVAPALIFVVMVYVVANGLPRFLNLGLVGLLGVFAAVSLTGLTTDYPDGAFVRFTTYGGLLAAGFAVASALAILGDRGITCVRRGLIVGAAVSSFLLIDARIRGNFIGDSDAARLQSRVTAGLADPNDIALALAIALPACLWSKHWLPRYVVAPLVVAGLLFTGSRGGLTALAAGGLAAIVVVSATSEHPIRQAGKAAGAATVTLLTAWAFLPEGLSERFSKLPQELTGGTMTRRTLYWEAAWEQYSESPFWGAGSGSSPYLNSIRTGRSQVFHNTYLSFLVELGLVGGLFFLLAMAAAWMGAARTSRTWGWTVVSMTIMSVGIWALSWDAKKVMWLLLITCGALLTQSKVATQPAVAGDRANERSD